MKVKSKTLNRFECCTTCVLKLAGLRLFFLVLLAAAAQHIHSRMSEEDKTDKKTERGNETQSTRTHTRENEKFKSRF